MNRLFTRTGFFKLAIIFQILLSLFLHKSPLHSKPYNILDGESPYILPPLSVEPRLMIGYETGYIPDVFVRPWIDLGILKRLTVGGGIYYTWFTEAHRNRISEWEVRGKGKIMEIPGKSSSSGFFSLNATQLFGYLKYRKSDEALIKRNSGPTGAYSVVSPRADGGQDFILGFSSRSEFRMFRQNFGLFNTADYAWTEGRDYYPDELEYKNRLTANIMPVYFLNFIPPKYVQRDSLFVGLQNRFTYWFKRGSMYNLMPQASWEFRKATVLSAGVSIPVSSKNDYRYLVECSTVHEFFRYKLETKLEVEPDKDFTPDGNGENDLLYLKPSVSSKEDIREWTITIRDGRKGVKRFQGRGKPSDKITWDGRTDKGQKVSSLKEYNVTLTVTDVKGKASRAKAAFAVGLILEKIPNGYKIVVSNIEFATGKHNLKSNAYPLLNRIAKYLDEHHRDYSIRIEGHTDNVGGEEANQNLSLKRAKSVMDYLAGKGVKKSRMSHAGFGETKPQADNTTEEGRARNRRVEFILEKK